MEREAIELRALSATALTGIGRHELAQDAQDLELAAAHLRELLSRPIAP